MHASINFYLLLVFITCGKSTFQEVVRLNENLFANHSTKIRPLVKQSHSLGLNVSLEISYATLNGFELSANIKFDILWIDEILQWKPSDYANVDSIYPEAKNMWLPQFQVMDSLDDTGFKCTKSVIQLQYSGMVRYACHTKIQVKCQTSFIHYPFDDHVCQIVIYLENYQNNEVRFSSSKFKVRERTPDEETIDWKISISTGIQNRNLNITVVAMEVGLHLERDYVFLIEFMLMPLMLLSLLNLQTFWIPERSLQVYYSVMILLMMIILLLQETTFLPRTSNCALNIYVTGLFILNILTVNIAVGMLRYQTKQPMQNHHPGAVKQPDFEFDFRNPHNFLFYEKIFKSRAKVGCFSCFSKKIDDTLAAQLRAYIDDSPSQSKYSDGKLFILFAALWCFLTIFYFIKTFRVV